MNNTKLEVTCDFRVSPKCKGTWDITRRTFRQTQATNEGKIICLPCSRHIKARGRQNPNSRYQTLDDHFFANVETEAKAYLLGWIASDGSISKKGKITIAIHQEDQPSLARLRDIICPEIPIKCKKNRPLVYFDVNSQQIQEDVCRWLEIKPGKKDSTVGFPELSDDTLIWAFIRGYFDGDGSISKPITGRLRCNISSNSDKLRRRIKEFCGIKCSDYGDKLEWNYSHALDFMHKLYHKANYYLPRKKELYVDWGVWLPSLRGTSMSGNQPLFHWVKTDKRSQAPFKERASDSGYDLTLIEKIGEHGPIELYTTGIKVQPIYGWYFDLVPRSSIVKTGYMLANSVGVIDRTYVGPIIVPLVKVDTSVPDLSLPARIVQIIPRPIIHVDWILVDELEPTNRGEGGFGSTGV